LHVIEELHPEGLSTALLPHRSLQTNTQQVIGLRPDGGSILFHRHNFTDGGVEDLRSVVNISAKVLDLQISNSDTVYGLVEARDTPSEGTVVFRLSLPIDGGEPAMELDPVSGGSMCVHYNEMILVISDLQPPQHPLHSANLTQWASARARR